MADRYFSMNHIPNADRHCVLCSRNYRVGDMAPCPGPPGFNAADREKRAAFAAKIKTVTIHPKGR